MGSNLILPRTLLESRELYKKGDARARDAQHALIVRSSAFFFLPQDGPAREAALQQCWRGNGWNTATHEPSARNFSQKYVPDSLPSLTLSLPLTLCISSVKKIDNELR